MRCKLCQKDKKLVKAHSIPEWAFNYCYPESDPNRKKSLILFGPDGLNQRRPTGVYDKDILCEKCDNYLGKFDNYGKMVFLDRKIEKHPEDESFYIISKIDVRKLKNFLISVVWRIGISKRQEFSQVQLGPYEEKIKRYLIKQIDGIKNSNDINNYSVIICKFETENNFLSDVVNRNLQFPNIGRIYGINVVLLYLSKGFKIFVKIDKRRFPIKLERMLLGASPDLLLVNLGDYKQSSEFRAMMKTRDKRKAIKLSNENSI